MQRTGCGRTQRRTKLAARLYRLRIVRRFALVVRSPAGMKSKRRKTTPNGMAASSKRRRCAHRLQLTGYRPEGLLVSPNPVAHAATTLVDIRDNFSPANSHRNFDYSHALSRFKHFDVADKLSLFQDIQRRSL